MHPTGTYVILGIVIGVLALSLIVVAVVLVRAKSNQRALDAARAGALAAAKTNIEQQAVAAERARILREMHDIIAHSLAIMVAQADGGSFIVADTQAAQRAFRTIADTGRAAVDETRRVLGMLKSPTDVADLAPMPNQFSIDRLIETSRASGMSVYLIRLGEPRALPASLGLTLYRICQEALTNVMKHAGEGAQVTVTENWRKSDMVFTVTDQWGKTATNPSEVPAVTAQAKGQGILGMKERAGIVGATLVAEPYEEGFRVRMVLPAPQTMTDAPDAATAPVGYLA